MGKYGISPWNGRTFSMHGNAGINVLNSEGQGYRWMPGYAECVLQHAPLGNKAQDI